MTNQQKLLSSFQQRNLDEFEKLVKCDDVNINHFYEEPDNGRLLDLACRSDGNSDYVLILLLNGASIWHRYDTTRNSKLLEAIEKNPDPIMKKYLEITQLLQIELQDEEFDDTPIQTAVEENDINTMKLIAYNCAQETSYNPKSSHLLLLQGSIEAVREFIEYFDVDVEFQKDSQCQTRTCREIILQKYPQLEPELPTRSSSELPQIIFSYLRNNAPDLFLNRIVEISTDILNDSKTEYDKTYLHLACEKGHLDVVNALLDRHVQLNQLARDRSDFSSQVTPIMMAAYKGHYKIVERLFHIPDVDLLIEQEGSILHSVIRGMSDHTVSRDDHRKILKLLLHRKYGSFRLNLDHRDGRNKTPLHLAIDLNNEFAIKCLVYAGANLYTKDHQGKIPLTLIPAEILESYFDDSISSEQDRVRENEIEQIITFNYSVFKKVDKNHSATAHEMEFFAVIERVPQLRNLFTHPLAESFLYVKWCLVKKYYYLNFAFYLPFCVALSAYIFQMQDCPSSSTSSNISQSMASEISHHSPSICNASWLGPITLVFYIVFILRELCQIFLSIRLYFSSPENWLEMAMIFTVGVFFSNKSNEHLAATAILLSWTEFVFLLGKHPSFSIYIEMFKTVAWNFAKFLTLYSILVASFAYSFFILFRDKTQRQISPEHEIIANVTDQRTEDPVNWWRNPIISFAKSIIMMTGELDASSLPLGSNLGYNHVFFIVFIFSVTMVLYNLLNGLAVSDTQAIMKDAEVVALMCRVKLITQLERLAVSNPIQCFRWCCPKFINRRYIRQLESGCLYFRDEIFADEISQSAIKVSVQSSENYAIRFDKFGKIFGKMPSNIIRKAEQVMKKRNQSEFAKNIDEDSPDEEIVKNTLPKRELVDELVFKFSNQIRDLKHEIDTKVAEINDKIAQIDIKIVERDEKLLQSVDERNNKLLESVLQAVGQLKQKEKRLTWDELL